MIRHTPEFDQRIADWLEADPAAAPADVLSTVVAALPSIPQARRGLLAPWRLTHMTNFTRAAAGVAIAAVVGVGVLALNSRPSGPGGTGSPAPTLTAAPSATAAPTSSLAIGTTYTSSVYGFSIGYPQGWRIEAAAQRRWDGEIDTKLDWSTPAVDTFVNPTGSVAVSAWQVPYETDIDVQSRQALMDFAETFCIASGGSQCTGIPERAVQMCRERADCHPAIIVPFENEVLAYFTSSDDAHAVVISVWQGDSAPEVAEYGGSIELLKTILSSMNVWTPQPGQASLE